MNPSSPNNPQSELIATAYDPQTTRLAGEHMVDLLSHHLRVVQDASGPVLHWFEPDENIALAHEQLAMGETEPPSDVSELLARFDQLIEQALSRGQNLHHPHYVGHQVPASLPLAGLFDAVTTMTNQVMAIYEMGPWATAIERAVVDKLGEKIGFTTGKFTGLVTSGGSLANLTALLTARNISLGDSWSQGLTSPTSKNRPAPVLVTPHPSWSPMLKPTTASPVPLASSA